MGNLNKNQRDLCADGKFISEMLLTYISKRFILPEIIRKLGGKDMVNVSAQNHDLNILDVQI